jgi:hypothetical protein
MKMSLMLSAVLVLSLSDIGMAQTRQPREQSHQRATQPVRPARSTQSDDIPKEVAEAQHLENTQACGASLPETSGVVRRDTQENRCDLVYLEVWQQPVTAVDDDVLSEVGLEGEDTQSRGQDVELERVRAWNSLSDNRTSAPKD